MSDAGRRWAETAQVRRPLLLRWYRIAVAVFVSIWFGWDVVHGLLGSQPDDRWAVLAGLVVGWASFAALSVGWERLSPRWARWLLGLLLLEMALIVPMLFEGDLVARSFAGAFMICFVCAVLLASFTGRPKGLAAGFANRKLNRHDAYIKRRAAAERSFDITGRPPLITAFPIPQSDQLALMALADELRRARRRFRRGPSTRGRLLFVGGDALGKAQLGVSIAYRAGSSLLRMDWAEWDPDGDGRAAFTEAFTLARQRRDGVVVMNGGTRFNSDEASWLASAIDSIDWPLILIFTAQESNDLEWVRSTYLDAVANRLACSRAQPPAAATPSSGSNSNRRRRPSKS